MKKQNIRITFSQNWRKYILEFIMLFLAVFLGFLADAYREERKELSNEREYIASLIDDVNSDILANNVAVKTNKVRKAYLDTLGNLCYNYKKADKWEIYRYLPMILEKPDFLTPNEFTFSQLKNAGGMRLIRNKEMAKEIYHYDLSKQKLINQQQYYENYQNQAIGLANKIFNFNSMMSLYSAIQNNSKFDLEELTLFQNDERFIKEFANNVMMYSGVVDYYIMLLEDANEQARSFIETAKKEYKIK